jgi:uncharacterized protein YfiM (DUF2279 family)
VIRGFLLVFSLRFGDEHPRGDHWFLSDKAKHFFTAAFVQSASFGGLRTVGVGRSWSLTGASVLSSAVSVGKEVYDARVGGKASAKDLTWDAAGIIAATALLHRTER